MPGAYAHITMVNIAHGLVRRDADTPANVRIASSDYLKFVELGGVSPDYPYLDALSGSASSWADDMHYTNTTDMIKSGAARVAKMQGGLQTKCLAWLLGYAAHVAGDVTIHPIVEGKVGEYKTHKKQHRVCEMHQDAYIYTERMKLGAIGLSEHLDSTTSGIMSCHRSDDPSRIDEAILDLWMGMFEDVYPDAFATQPPNIDSWHAKFGPRVDIIEEGDALPPFAHHIAASQGLTYPEAADLEEFINALETPEGEMTYDVIFDRACTNIIALWRKIGLAVETDNIDTLADLTSWNLDTGKDETGTFVYWTV